MLAYAFEEPGYDSSDGCSNQAFDALPFSDGSVLETSAEVHPKLVF
jgi:hypothetical protein